MKVLYIVATTQKEADEIGTSNHDVKWETKKEANTHLAYVKSPPTDPYYAAQYKVFKVKV